MQAVYTLSIFYCNPEDPVEYRQSTALVCVREESACMPVSSSNTGVWGIKNLRQKPEPQDLSETKAPGCRLFFFVGGGGIN